MPQRTESDLDPAPPATEGPWRPRRGSAPGLLFTLGRGSWAPVQGGPGRATFRVETPGATYFVKHYVPRSPWRRLRDFLFRRKPQRAFALGRRLLRGGVSTPEPLGLFFLGRGLPREALLVSEWLEEATPWTRRLVVLRGMGPEALQEALSAMAALLGRLHRLGHYHGDLPGNLVFARSGAPYLIDLDDLHGGLTRRRRVKNLEELGRALPSLEDVSLRRRWLFLLGYAEAAGLSRARARVLWRQGRAAQVRRARRRSQRGGPGVG